MWPPHLTVFFSGLALLTIPGTQLSWDVSTCYEKGLFESVPLASQQGSGLSALSSNMFPFPFKTLVSVSDSRKYSILSKKEKRRCPKVLTLTYHFDTVFLSGSIALYFCICIVTSLGAVIVFNLALPFLRSVQSGAFLVPHMALWSYISTLRSYRWLPENRLLEKDFSPGAVRCSPI